MPVVGTGNGLQNILPPLVHVVFGTNAYRFYELLRTNDMLDSMPKLFSQLAMSDKHKSNHDITAPIAYANRWPISQCSNVVHQWGDILAMKRRSASLKYRIYAPMRA
ncbi:hypothetical protein Rhsp01_51050 [Rhizobium sp. NBRC 114257]|uniref:Uncharacterized protein n=1 Tax=Rhizobium dioscoreae TaxID=2653122 RepID=A0ABQ0ZAT7_9HYPH|nr:hypothetical protein RsS93_52140 [Rhizobium dioscoreae]GLU83929.1 hypothetical protein Rhsp01_51050 [Rhizobium sp. NBRC 114257]